MSDREKVIGHLYDCLAASKPENLWVFVRKDIVGDALNLLKEQEAQIERLEHDLAVTQNNLNYYVNGND